MATKFKFDKIINTTEKNIKPTSENLCLFYFFKNAERIAIIKSSLLADIRF